MKILVVDDEKDIQLLFQQCFRKEIKNGEFSFEFAFSAEEALEYLKKYLPKSILILSDINMPGMSGFDLLDQINSKYTDPPRVIMISAYGDEKNHNQAKRLGVSEFITKPVNFKYLKEKLKINLYG